MSVLSPFDRLLQAHEQTTGYKERRSGSSTCITCAVCRTKSYKVPVAIAANGSVLLHAFCGHLPGEVLACMGLQMADLFVRKDLRTLSPAESRQFRQDAHLSAMQAAWVELRKELTVVLIALNQMLDGKPFTDADLTRLEVARRKIFDGIEVLSNGR